MPPPPPGIRPAGTNTKAVWSLVLGICGIFVSLAGIAALILGYRAKREIRSTGQPGGDLATAGIVLGWVGVALAIASLAVLLLSSWRW